VSAVGRHGRRSNPRPPASRLIRLYRSLDALVGNDGEKRLAWMNSHNRALSGVPRDLMQKAEGLCAAVAYLDGMRATL